MRCDGPIPAPEERHINVVLQQVIVQLDENLCRVDSRDVQMGDLVNRGPLAAVFRGTHRGSPVAIKQLYSQAGNDALTPAQLREIEVLRQLQHPAILSIIGTCPPPESYIVSPWFMHGDLSNAIIAYGAPLPVHTTLKIATCISGAMEYLHERNILHRDVKPANCLLTCALAEVVSADVPCILSDFGCAKPATPAATMTGMVGTPAYSAPEVLQSQPYGRPADVYSFGVSVF